MGIRKLIADSWENAITALGTAQDKTKANKFGRPSRVVNIEELRSLYDYDWLAAKIVNALPAMAFRKGVVSSDEQAQKELNRLNYSPRYPTGALQSAIKFGRLEGGAALLLGVQSAATPDQPFSLGARLKHLDVLRKDDLQVLEIDTDPDSPTVGLAKRFRIVGNHARHGLEIHASRLIWCEGRELAERDSDWLQDSGTQSSGFHPWGSVLQPVYETLADYGMSWTAVSHMLQEASIGVMTLDGWLDMISSVDQSEVEKRMSAMSLGRSVAKTICLDASGHETYKREAVSFADVPQLMQQLMYRISGAANIPATVLFGVSPSGQNATGESDLTQWYDQGREYQTVSLEPKIKTLLGLCGASENVEVNFPSLWEPTKQEQAQTQLTKAQAERLHWDMGKSESEIKKILGEE